MTLKLLHHEYTGAAKESAKIPYAYRTFAEKYGHYARKFKLTMPLRRKPGEIMEVDWAGATLSIQDRATGEDLTAYVFVAALRNAQCFHINELNQYIAEKLEEINTTDFQKRPGSRKSVFEEEEKHTLQQLPQTRFKMTEWKTAKVQLNYHIQVERMYYSVPYEYARETLDIRLTTDLIEVYFKEARIASHKRLKGEIGQYSTNLDHMPDHHRSYVEHNPENIVKWAATIGPFTEKYVMYILEHHVEKKALQILSTLQNMVKKYTPEELEQAITTLVEISSNPSNTVLKGVLERTKQASKTKNQPAKITSASSENHGFTRGAAYFGKEKK